MDGIMSEYSESSESSDAKKEKDDDFKIALERFADACDSEREERKEQRDDVAFISGKQWPEEVKLEREKAGRPCLTHNLLNQFIRQITGDIRQNKPGIKVLPANDGANKETAEIYAGLIRHIEQVSDATTAYTNGAEGMARAGMGHWRVKTQYSGDDGFEQDIRIKRIKDPFAVYWDPNAEEFDRSDAEWCFVIERMSLAKFKKKYPKARTDSFQTNQNDSTLSSDWKDGKTITIAEYWCKKKEKKTLLLLSDGSVIEEEGLTEEMSKALDEKQVTILKTRPVEVDKVYQRMMNGVEWLDKETAWPGKYIPIVTCVGEEYLVDDRMVRHGVVRWGRDPQRMFNYMRSASAEQIALAPKAPVVGTKKQFEGHESQWRQASRSNVDFLTYNHDPNAPGRPSRLETVTPHVAANEFAQASQNDMYASIGIYPPSLGARSNETSGRAIIAREKQGDTGTYLYSDNVSKAISYTGRILVDLIPKIFDTTRVVRIIGQDDEESMVTLNEPTMKEGEPTYATKVEEKNGECSFHPPLDAGEYDVAVVTGPSYATKRAESAESLMSFVAAVPIVQQVAADLIAKNMDWPGAEAIAERLKKALPPGIAEDSQPSPPPPPNPKDVADAELKAAQAQKAKEETRGVAIDNTQKELELAQMAGLMQSAVAAAVASAMPMALQQALIALTQAQSMQQMPPQGMMPSPQLPA